MQTTVQCQGLLCHGAPTVVLLDARAALLAQAAAQGWISEYAVERLGETFGKLRGVAWLVRGSRRQVRIDEIPRLTVHHHFGNAAHGAGDDWGGAGHGLEVDQAERLIDGRTTEHGGMRVERYAGIAWHHGRYPDDPRALLLQAVHAGLDLLRHLGGICRSSAQHDLDIRGKIRDGFKENRQGLLLG